TFMPCFSSTTFATFALAAEPSHGLTASVIVPLSFDPPAVVVPLEPLPLLLLLLHAANASASTAIPMTIRRLPFMPSPSLPAPACSGHAGVASPCGVCPVLLPPTLGKFGRARPPAPRSPHRLRRRARARSWSDRRRHRRPARHLRRARR